MKRHLLITGSIAAGLILVSTVGWMVYARAGRYSADGTKSGIRYTSVSGAGAGRYVTRETASGPHYADLSAAVPGPSAAEVAFEKVVEAPPAVGDHLPPYRGSGSKHPPDDRIDEFPLGQLHVGTVCAPVTDDQGMFENHSIYLGGVLLHAG